MSLPWRKKQNGVYSVEFALVGLTFFMLLFMLLELGRLFFIWNVLTEASRRGARLASVCSFDSGSMSAFDGMKEAALFNNDLDLVPNLALANLQIEYLTFDGDAAANFAAVDLVRAKIIGYSLPLITPGFTMTLNSPRFSTILPRESLGVSRFGPITCTPNSPP